MRKLQLHSRVAPLTLLFALAIAPFLYADAAQVVPDDAPSNCSSGSGNACQTESVTTTSCTDWSAISISVPGIPIMFIPYCKATHDSTRVSTWYWSH